MNNTRPQFIVGDALRVLPILPDDCVDVVLTDMPFKDEDLVCEDGIDYYQVLSSWFNDCKRVAKDYVMFFNNASRLYDILSLLGEPKRILLWVKKATKFPWRWEPIFVYQATDEPSWNINATIWSDTLPHHPLHKGQSSHPYEKPLSLMENLVRYIPEDKIILDTFCGIGTTNVACQRLHRASIGIDINKDYINMAKKRCRVDISSLGDFDDENFQSNLQLRG